MDGNKLTVYHNSQDINYRSPFGAVPAGRKIRLALSVFSPGTPEEVVLRLWLGPEGEKKVPMTASDEKEKNGGRFYRAEIVPDRRRILWYYFIVRYRGNLYYYSRPDNRYGGAGCLECRPLHSYQITVFKPGFHVPKWYREGVVYQIFPDRFRKGGEGNDTGNSDIVSAGCADDSVTGDSVADRSDAGRPDGNHGSQRIFHENWEEPPCCIPDPETGKIRNNDFYGGNLQGILDKLDYLMDLGITVIYLNPVFEAASNHRYDTGDYLKIDPMLGDLQTFRRLCARAKSRGISIILDGVFSHTGSDSVYFNKEGRYPGPGAWQNEDSPYFSWYRFRRFPEDYDCWWGVRTLPNVNEMEPSYLDFIARKEDSVVRYWLKRGAGGWRLDVADELPDAFIRELRKAVKEADPDAVVIGEVWEDASNKVSYGSLREYLLGEELDSVMNYPFRNLVLDFLLGGDDGEKLFRGSMTLYENYPREAFFGAMNLLGSHDVARLRTILGEAPAETGLTLAEQAEYRMTEEQKALADRRQKLAVVLQMTMPGVPSVYYGDEAGMEGYRDPLNRGTYPWGREDKPMAEWYRRLICLRNRTDALKKGEYLPVLHQDGMYGFIRQIEKNRDVFGEYAENGFLLILVNRDAEAHETDIRLPGHTRENLKGGLLRDALHPGREVRPAPDGRLVMNLEPFGCVVLVGSIDDFTAKSIAVK